MASMIANGFYLAMVNSSRTIAHMC